MVIAPLFTITFGHGKVLKKFVKFHFSCGAGTLSIFLIDSTITCMQEFLLQSR